VVVEYGLSLRYGLTTPIQLYEFHDALRLCSQASLPRPRTNTGSSRSTGGQHLHRRQSQFHNRCLSRRRLTTTLTYPRAITVTDVEQYTGIAIVNTGGRAALLNFRALDASGTFGGGSGTQTPRSGSSTRASRSRSWRTKYSEARFPDSKGPGLDRNPEQRTRGRGFFIVFDTSLTSINGTILSKQTSKSLIFPETVPEAVVRVMLRNPNDTSAVVSFDLVSTQGWNLSSVSRTVGPRSSWLRRSWTCSPGFSAERYSYLRIASNQPLYGYELVESSSQWISLLERPATGSRHEEAVRSPVRVWRPVGLGILRDQRRADSGHGYPAMDRR